MGVVMLIALFISSRDLDFFPVAEERAWDIIVFRCLKLLSNITDNWLRQETMPVWHNIAASYLPSRHQLAEESKAAQASQIRTHSPNNGARLSLSKAAPPASYTKPRHSFCEKRRSLIEGLETQGWVARERPIQLLSLPDLI